MVGQNLNHNTIHQHLCDIFTFCEDVFGFWLSHLVVVGETLLWQHHVCLCGLNLKRQRLMRKSPLSGVGGVSGLGPGFYFDTVLVQYTISLVWSVKNSHQHTSIQTNMP